MNGNNYFLDTIMILFYYYNVCFTSDWYIDHNELHLKKIKANKFLTPISYIKQKNKGKYKKIELFIPIIEIYAHLVLLAYLVNVFILKGISLSLFNRYFFIISFIIYGMIFIVYNIVCKKRKHKK